MERSQQSLHGPRRNSKRTPTIPWLREFLSQIYYNYSTLTSSLTSLLKGKPKSLSWDPDADHAFQTLKNKFITAPLLRHPNPDLAFIVEVDASTTGVGAILSQHQENAHKPLPCAILFKEIVTELNRTMTWVTENSSPLNWLWRSGRHWLEGAQHPFMVLTDHKNLQYLKEAKRLNPRQARWALFFTRFPLPYYLSSRNQEHPCRCLVPSPCRSRYR